MSAEVVLWRLRRFLLLLAAGALTGTLVELWAAKHTEEPMQLIPFVLCGVGMLALAVAGVRPGRRSLLALRTVMGIVALGSLVGIYEHIENDAAFYQETHPDAAFAETVVAALQGRDPLLAPGILALAATLAIAATYRHPALEPAAPIRAVNIVATYT